MFGQKATFKISEDQAKDAFQEAILTPSKCNIGSFGELTSSVKTYLFQIGKHKAINIQKKEPFDLPDTVQLIEGKK
ncbi:MAG: hypothetical protein R2779_11635 [Crocinitomicaceae bacterium]